MKVNISVLILIILVLERALRNSINISPLESPPMLRDKHIYILEELVVHSLRSCGYHNPRSFFDPITLATIPELQCRSGSPLFTTRAGSVCDVSILHNAEIQNVEI